MCIGSLPWGHALRSYSFPENGLSIPHWYLLVKLWYTPGMDKKQKAKTIRLDEPDWQAIAAIKEYSGIHSDNDALRFALRETFRLLQATRAKATHALPLPEEQGDVAG